MLAGCSKKAAQAPPVVEEAVVVAAPVVEERPPAPKPIQLSSPAPVVLDPGGQAKIELRIERNGNEGPAEFSVVGAAAGITTKIDPIPAAASAGQLEILAAETLGDDTLETTLQITAKIGEQVTTQPMVVTVKKLNMPTFLTPAPILLQPGAKANIVVQVERNGYEGPLALRLEGLPAKVTGKVEPLAEGQSQANVEIAAASDAGDVNQKASLAVTHFGRTISTEITLQIDRSPFVVKAFQVVKVKPGETVRVTIPIERRSYQGVIRLEATNLAEGVTSPAIDVPANQPQGILEVSATASAAEQVRTATVVASAGALKRTEPLVVRVSRGEGSFLAWEVGSNKELFPQLRRGSFGGRMTSAGKKALLAAYGGTEESEAGVLAGLRWLAAHQQADGRWSLKNYAKDISGCDCHLEFESEVVDYDTAGTAFGVLPFLGAGITHNSAPDSPPELAKYQKTVERGLAYLMQNQVTARDPKTIGNLGGNLYSHAMATMALCEAYGMSGDDRLRLPAQLAVKYLLESQHAAAGGWRYGPNQAGDLSATSWMFLAMRDAQMAGLTIEQTPLKRAERFIDSCAAGPDEAKLSRYAYQPDAEAKLSLTAAGLLTREYLGWKRDNPHLRVGAAYLMQNQPPESATQLGQIYYYYYATQVLHHLEGSEFDLWNHRMREHLLRTQEKEGHQAGSWSPVGADWGKQGGRLYATSLALSTLEVYYRHFPMYRPVSKPTP
ncbi:MAG: hypothetical protein O3C40_01995 [Planctomycetota bacterium]|nr:hypothetical protein [Planctomycetota bacterium]